MSKRIHKPVDMIVSNFMFDSADQIRQLSSIIKLLGADANCDAANEALLRDLLRVISANADLRVICDALKAIGAPCSIEDMREGRRAAVERCR